MKKIMLVLGSDATATTVLQRLWLVASLKGTIYNGVNTNGVEQAQQEKEVDCADAASATLHILSLALLLWSPVLCTLQAALSGCSPTEASLVLRSCHAPDAGMS